MDRRINTRRKARKDHNKSNSSDDHDDDVSLVKAAAWAWHQRSNSSFQSDHQAIIIKPKTSDTTRFHHNPKPSRYKLEAMRMASSSQSKNDELTLLDAYEVRSIKMRLDSLILESTNSCRCNMNNELSNNGSVSAKANLDDQKKKKKKKKVMMRKGIWVRHGVICSTREEQVVDVTRRRRSSSSPNTKKVPAIHLHQCLPKANCLPTRVESSGRKSTTLRGVYI